MKTLSALTYFVRTLTFATLVALTMTGCAPSGERGTVGASGFGVGTGAGAGADSYAFGGTSRYQQAGMPDVNIAASREAAALDVSGSGTSELARRAASAGERPVKSGARDGKAPSTVPQMTGDDILLDRVQQALNFATPGNAPDFPALSIQSLNNLDVTVKDGVVHLRGEVSSPEEKNEVEKLVRSVSGVKAVDDQLKLMQDPLLKSPLP